MIHFGSTNRILSAFELQIVIGLVRFLGSRHEFVSAAGRLLRTFQFLAWTSRGNIFAWLNAIDDTNKNHLGLFW